MEKKMEKNHHTETGNVESNMGWDIANDIEKN